MKISIKKFWFLFIILSLIIPACKPETRQASSIETAEMVIIYQREGGLAGRSEQWTIYPDGMITAPQEQELSGDPEETSSVFTLAANEETKSLKESYVPDDNCCDKFIYVITIQIGNEEQTIQTSDDVPQPDHLTELMSAIEMLIANASEAN